MSSRVLNKSKAKVAQGLGVQGQTPDPYKLGIKLAHCNGMLFGRYIGIPRNSAFVQQLRIRI
jgi:hypothetical protein